MLVHHYVTPNHAFENSAFFELWEIHSALSSNADNKMCPDESTKMFTLNGILVLEMKINVLCVNTQLISAIYTVEKSSIRYRIVTLYLFVVTLSLKAQIVNHLHCYLCWHIQISLKSTSSTYSLSVWLWRRKFKLPSKLENETLYILKSYSFHHFQLLFLISLPSLTQSFYLLWKSSRKTLSFQY